jgi:hypothetical protein
VQNKLTPSIIDNLDSPFTAEDVLNAISGMKGLAAPGPYGLPAIFYHSHWNIVGPEITKIVLNVLNNQGDPSPFNNIHICLIPKKNNPQVPSDFRPISLCNVTHKIITKVIANRIKLILSDVISPNQSAFLPGRLISDNTIIAYELFHYFQQTSSTTGFIGMKTDMAKAYDRVEWEFLQATLNFMGFPKKLIQTIMKCVSTVSFSILING